MDSYFFIPADRLHKIENIRQLNVDQIIIDLEDAIKSSERTTSLQALKDDSIDRSLYIRVPVYSIEGGFDLEMYREFKMMGFKNFIIPKLENTTDFEKLAVEISPREKIILLIETPLFLIELKDILVKYHHLISGLGLGSHDLMNELGAAHTLYNLEFYRNLVLLYAKAYKLTAFDIASMELKNAEELKEEILNGFEKGFEAKFYIHPWQIEVKDGIDFYNEHDLGWATKIFEEYKKVGNEEEFNPIVVDGEIIEKPHLSKVFTILKYFKKHESK